MLGSKTKSNGLCENGCFAPVAVIPGLLGRPVCGRSFTRLANVRFRPIPVARDTLRTSQKSRGGRSYSRLISLDSFKVQRTGLAVAVGPDVIGQALARLGRRRLAVP